MAFTRNITFELENPKIEAWDFQGTQAAIISLIMQVLLGLESLCTFFRWRGYVNKPDAVPYILNIIDTTSHSVY